MLGPDNHLQVPFQSVLLDSLDNAERKIDQNINKMEKISNA